MVVWETLDALSHELELCRIDAATTVVVLLDPATETTSAQLIRAAVARTGAESLEVRPIAPGPSAGLSMSNQPLVATALDAADVVITNLDVPLDQARWRVLLVLPGIDASRYAPHVSMRRRVLDLTERIGAATALQLIDGHGTDLRVGLTGSSTAGDYGMLDPEHRASTFPSGWVEITPARRSVQGELVLMPGDANVTGRRLLSSPVRLQLQNDHISAIEGDSPDADVLRAQLEHAGDPAAYGIGDLSIGLNAGRGPVGLFDDRLIDPWLSRLAAGVVSISFGENLLADRPCASRLGLALPGRSVRLDDLPVVSDGRLDGDFAPDVYER